LTDRVADVIVIGGGPSGAHAAAKAVQLGLEVVLVDPAVHEPALENLVPAEPFSTLRRTDAKQASYFLGPNLAQDLEAPIATGAQLTPPRKYILEGIEQHLPFQSESFHPLQTLALGGLGAAWGAGAYAFEPFELLEAGMPPDAMRRHYDDVAREIGISGAKEDDTAEQLLRFGPIQPPLPLDSNSEKIFSTYTRKRAELNRRGFRLGRPAHAILTQPLTNDGMERHANPLFDMDFYTNAGRSVYRPVYTLSVLAKRHNFRHVKNTLATTFWERDDRVDVECLDLQSGRQYVHAGRRLIIAAGALNTARLVLRSKKMFDVRVPLLCNAYHYIAAINLNMLGRPAADQRHSYAQLVGTLTGDDRDSVVMSFFSYRSLLLYRLVKEMPTHTSLGLLAARLLLTAFTIIGLHHPERFSPDKWLSLKQGVDGKDVLVGGYSSSAAEKNVIGRNVARAISCLRTLGCLPINTLDPQAGASIHYAGTLPTSKSVDDPLGTSSDGKLNLTSRVYIADSAPWQFLPAKGLTLTLMANARRISEEACAGLVHI
jgi:hypothetical protein